MLHEVNLCVHQPSQPRWEIVNAPRQRGFLHLAYEDGEHYNSVRKADDDGLQPVVPFAITEAMLSGEGGGSGGGGSDAEGDDAVQQLLYCTPCRDAARAREVCSHVARRAYEEMRWTLTSPTVH